MPRQRSQHELRCFCRTEPLLAVYGINEKNELYIHVRIYKQQRIYGEIIVTRGEVKLHCRECLRWHKVVIRQPDSAILEETRPPRIGATTP